MCTVSWVETANGYELFFNRDERRTRKTACAPATGKSRGVHFVAPADAAAGGTWIAANEYGLTLCLLNRYGEGGSQVAHDFKSRGLLLPDLMCRRDPAEVMRAVAREGLAQFQPFTLLAIAPAAAPAVLSWTGDHLLVAEDDVAMLMPLTSSSFAGAEVVRVRRETFRELLADSTLHMTDLLLRFHHGHFPAPGPFSVCMHRPEASTVSFSRVRVNARSVEFYYQPGPPCARARGVNVSLPRAPRRLAGTRAATHYDGPRELSV